MAYLHHVSSPWPMSRVELSRGGTTAFVVGDLDLNCLNSREKTSQFTIARLRKIEFSLFHLFGEAVEGKIAVEIGVNKSTCYGLFRLGGWLVY